MVIAGSDRRAREVGNEIVEVEALAVPETARPRAGVRIGDPSGKHAVPEGMMSVAIEGDAAIVRSVVSPAGVAEVGSEVEMAVAKGGAGPANEWKRVRSPKFATQRARRAGNSVRLEISCSERLSA